VEIIGALLAGLFFCIISATATIISTEKKDKSNKDDDGGKTTKKRVDHAAILGMLQVLQDMIDNK
jgi:hypothetical protein